MMEAASALTGGALSMDFFKALLNPEDLVSPVKEQIENLHAVKDELPLLVQDMGLVGTNPADNRAIA